MPLLQRIGTLGEVDEGKATKSFTSQAKNDFKKLENKRLLSMILDIHLFGYFRLATKKFC